MAEEAEGELEWHLNRGVPISIILAILTLAASGIWLVAEIRRDIDLLKAAQAAQHERDERQDKAQAEGLALVRADLHDIKTQLARLIERR